LNLCKFTKGKIMTNTNYLLTTFISLIIFGCTNSTTYIVENDDAGTHGETGNAGEAGSSGFGGNSGDTGTSGASGDTGTSGASGNSNTPETCLEAGERLSGVPGHSACGTVIDKNGNRLNCPTSCSEDLECGASIWDPSYNGDILAGTAWHGPSLINRFIPDTLGNVCGEGCVDLSNNADIEPPCNGFHINGVYVMCDPNIKPYNCFSWSDNLWCCANGSEYTMIPSDSF